MSNDTQVESSSGNVFADLDIPNAEEYLVKATIALAIAGTIRKRKLTQTQAGKILGLDQPSVSKLVRGQLDKFSIDRLLGYMKKLDYDVSISFKPKPKSRPEAVFHVNDRLIPA